MLVDKSSTLGLKGNIKQRIKDPTFEGIGQIWQKDHQLPEPLLGPQIHIYSFFKYGKTLGIQTKRYVEYLNGVLYYYDEEKDSKYKGYCKLENLYMSFFRTDDSFVLYLTNGVKYIEMYFEKNSFLKDLQSSFFRYVIQLDFKLKYSLKQKIGKGSFASVYIGEHCKKKTKVAVKLISKKDENGIETRSLVAQQKKIMSIANSPYLCEMKQFFQDEQNYIMVLEYLPGKNLLQVLRKNKNIKLKYLIQIIKNCMEGLKCLHRNGIIHRDLKPQNIMINEENFTAKIIDFGLSLILKNKMEKKAFRRCGTIGYMAHEVITNTPLNREPYDQKIDIFSMGIIVHLMLTGNNPLRGKTYQETLQNNSQCNLKIQTQYLVKKYGQESLKMIYGMLEKNPKKRMTADEVLKCQFLQNNQNQQNVLSDFQLQSEVEKNDNLHETFSPLLKRKKL